MIYCGNHFCAYWFEGICMKEDIRLDNRGVCLTWRAGRISTGSLLARQRRRPGNTGKGWRIARKSGWIT